jgi:hypothetical protein
MQRGMEVCVITRNKQQIVTALALSALTLAAIGCSHALPEARDSRAAGEWRYRLPTAPGPYAGLAFGRGGSSEPAQIAEPVASEQPMLAKLERPAQRKQSAHATRPSQTLAKNDMAEKAEQPTQQAAVLDAARVTAPEAPTTVASATPADASADASADQRYAEREAKSQKLQDYRGGDAIIISASALVIILLIVVLVLLLR